MNEEPLEQEEDKNLFEGFKEKLKNFEWGISLSVGGYLFLIFLGLTYNFFYFMMFRVNIFLFSEINDFLMAPLANPLVIVLALFNMGFLFGIYYLSFLWEKKHYKSYLLFWQITMFNRKMDKKGIDKYMKSTTFLIISIVLYLFIAAQYYAIYRSSKTSHDKNLFHYKLSIDKDVIINIDSLVYVGDNSAHYFLYDTLKREATIIPKEQVKFVTVKKNPKGKFF